MKIIRFVITALSTLLLIYLLDTKLSYVPIIGNLKSVASLPPLGPFFNPFGGFWANAEPRTPLGPSHLNLPGLQDEVEVLFDKRLIPHIFAKNEKDLYYTQGYITAKYRLWQMEFQTHAAAGRLSEFLGRGPDDRIFKYDLQQRRIGMVYGAEQGLAEVMAEPRTKNMLEAYAAGVNAYIDLLSPKDYPIEYKLLNYRPEAWTPLKSMLLLKYMSRTLSYNNDDLRLSNVFRKFGKEVTEEWFAGFPKNQSPTIPNEAPLRFKSEEIPKKPSEAIAPETFSEENDPSEDHSGIGSNNWVVGAEKSATGYPILADDMHLNLNLPSLWFEIQLSDSKHKVYGASLPGAPGIVVGFNENVSWGPTNVGADVIDWYKIHFKDSSHSQYWHDEKWKPLRKRVETIKIKDEEAYADTI